MAEIETYGFDLKEVTTALMKQQGIHSGLWMLAFEFSLGAGLAGPTKEEVRPVAFVQINKISLVRQNEISGSHNLVMNAAEINPAPSENKPVRKRSKALSLSATPPRTSRGARVR